MQASKSIPNILTFTLLAWVSCGVTAAPLGTTFTYQGRLNDGPNPASGSYDFRFAIYDAASGPAQIGNTLTNAAITVSNGLFTVALDFGEDVFTGDARWLEIAVCTNGSPADFTLLSPRQPLTPSPYALYAPSAGTAGSAAGVTGPIAANQISGTLAASNIGPGTITSAMLAPGSVTTAALADGAVTADKLQTADFTRWSGTITNPAPALNDNFGYAIAAVGADRLVVGAYRDDPSGVADAGAAFLFDANGALLATLPHPVPAENDQFGHAVTAVDTDKVLISARGNDTGADGAGAAYLLDLNGALLTTFTNPVPTANSLFGQAVAAVGTDKVLVGVNKYLESAFLFDLNGTLLTTFTNPVAGAAEVFASAVAGVGADRVLVGAQLNDTGADNAGAAYLFNVNGTLLTTFTNPAPAANAQFGGAVAALGAYRVLIGAVNGGPAASGAAYLLSTSGTLLATFTNPASALPDGFGSAVAALGTDRVIIGAYGNDSGDTDAGSAYVFDTNGILLATFTNPAPAASEYFGRAVAGLGRDTIVVGASGENTGAVRAGTVYLYQFERYLPGVAAEGAAPGSIQSGMLANGAVGNAQLATGAAAANLAASGQSGVGSGGIILSATENADLVNAGYVKIGELASTPERWEQRLDRNPRAEHTAVWTGSEMIVWGGFDGSNPLFTGGRYDPAADAWTAVSTTAAPGARYRHTAVWTGSQMIIWGGEYGGAALYSGGRYNPTANTWAAVSTTGAPAGRYHHTAVWTGSEMIVWGGYENLNYLDDGGRYNPTANSWTPVTSTGAPAGRCHHTAVWTGTEMIVWGGDNGSSLNTGSRYNPTANSWTAVTTTDAPAARYFHTAVWTGSEMIVWGGYSGSSLNTGSRYNRTANTWTPVTTTGAPVARYSHTAVWTGSEMIVWGGAGSLKTGSRYNPTNNSWAAVTTTGAPAGRYYHTAVWTGSEMIVHGGISSGSYLEDTWSFLPGAKLLLYQRQ